MSKAASKGVDLFIQLPSTISQLRTSLSNMEMQDLGLLLSVMFIY